MGVRALGSSIFRNIRNIPGWGTNRKIVVIESDDWGSIRIPSIEVYQRFNEFGCDMKKSLYNRYDGLESNDDLISLFDVLVKFKDSQGNPPNITANTIVANPDFAKIKNSQYEKYYYEHFTETLRRYPKHDQVFKLYAEGFDNKLFSPQLHGREHLNINRWLRALKKGEKNVLFGFDQHTTVSGQHDYNFMEAFDMDQHGEMTSLREIVSDGLRIFKDTFGYSSKTFIAPCYTWNNGIEEELSKNEVEYLQGSLYQNIPKGGFGNYKKIYHYLGEKSKNNLIYLVRNCVFEPTLVQKNDWVDYSLAGIMNAFRWRKPAIICSHRINFIGCLDEDNRNKNLKLFEKLLGAIIKKWPDVEFLNSHELGDLIRSEK